MNHSISQTATYFFNSLLGGSGEMLARLIVIACATVAGASLADAHGIAGNRFFVGTLTIDDPAVADEAILPGYTGLGHPSEAGNVLDNRINWSFVRLLTPTLQASTTGTLPKG